MNQMPPECRVALKKRWEKQRSTFVARFWSNITKTASGCWIWRGTITGRGYGSVKYGVKTHSTHRMAYSLINGTIPDGMQVCHKCDIPACINPEHLFLGTASDNQQDSVRKGRKPSIIGEKNPMYGVQGEAHPSHKLTADEVREMRLLYATGEFTQKELAKRFRTTQINVSVITLRKTWNHI